MLSAFAADDEVWINVHNPSFNDDPPLYDTNGAQIDTTFYAAADPDTDRKCVIFKQGDKLDGKDCTKPYYPICETACLSMGET